VRRGLLAAVVVTALLLLYLVVAAGRAVALLGSGQPIGVVMGAAVLLLPVLGITLLGREWWLAAQVQRMADELAARGALDEDTLPRTPGGRVDRVEADAQFEERRAAVQAAPEDWGAWFRLGFAYDAAHDRRRAREALRTAARLRRDGGRAAQTA
jgi:cytochrome c-type biogenesis protein CcmH/NrfG